MLLNYCVAFLLYILNVWNTSLEIIPINNSDT
jgi:hypothetical protein